MRAGEVRSIAGALVVLLILTVFIGGYYASKEMDHTELKDVWSYSSPEGAVEPLFVLERIGPDGTIYVQEGSGQYYDGRHSTYTDAIDQNGTLKWRLGTNARPFIWSGPDGNIHYIDWQDVSEFGDDYSLGRWCNFTTVDMNGNLLWNYQAENGSLTYWCMFGNGTAILSHLSTGYNYTLNEYGTITDSIIAVSDGQKLWEIDRPYNNMGYLSGQALENGTLLFKAENNSGIYQIGITNEGLVYIDRLSDYYYMATSPKSGNETARYDLRWEAVDLNTTEVSVYAINMTDGKQLWRTTLQIKDNPDHWQPNSGWMGWETLVDRDGVIYTGYDGNIYALDQNGSVLWKIGSGYGSLYDIFPTGGVLAGTDSSLLRIDKDGHIIWECDVKLYGGYPPLIGPNETMIVTHGNEISKMTVSTGNVDVPKMTMILALTAFVSIILVAANIKIWKMMKKKSE